MALFSYFAKDVSVKVFDFLTGKHVVIKARLNDDAARHFEEHGTFKSFVKIFSAHYLPMLAQKAGIVFFHRRFHVLRQLGRAGAVVRDDDGNMV